MATEIPVHRFEPAEQAPGLCKAYIEIAGIGMTCCGRRDAPEHDMPVPTVRITYKDGGVVVSGGPDCGCSLCEFRPPVTDPLIVPKVPIGLPPDEDPPPRWGWWIAAMAPTWVLIVIAAIIIW